MKNTKAEAEKQNWNSGMQEEAGKQCEQHNQTATGKSRRIVAMVGVIVLAVVFAALLVTAILDPTGVWFRSCLILAIALPILLWIYVWLYGMLKQKKTIASFEFLEEDQKEK